MANYPSTPAPAQITIISDNMTLVSTTHSLRRQAHRRGGQRWRFRLSYAPMLRDDFAALWGFLVSLRGRAGTCDFSLPILSTKRGVGGGSPVILNRENYTRRSEDFSESIWSRYSVAEDGSTSAPDLGPVSGLNDTAQGWTCTGSAVGHMTQAVLHTMATHNLLSIYVKFMDSIKSGINIYNYTTTTSYAAYCNWSGGDIISMTNGGADDMGYTEIGDGWWRIWTYHDGTGETGNTIHVYVYPDRTGTDTGTYMYGVNLYDGLTAPASYLPTATAELSAQDQGGQTIYTNGWPGSTDNVLRAGDLIQLPSDDKCYMAAEDVDSLDGGDAAIRLSSPVYVVPADGAALTTSGCTFSVSLADDLHNVSIDTALAHGFSVDLAEVPA